MALQPHDIDGVIGDEKRPACAIVSSLSKSEEFEALVTRAVRQSEVLPPGMCGTTFSQQVRVAIARDLLDQQFADAESN